jgi:hypothetical protein
MIDQLSVPVEQLVEPDTFIADVLALHCHHHEVEPGDLDLAILGYPGSTEDLIGSPMLQ